MEYSKVYDINRKMHGRPYAQVVGTFGELHGRYSGLEISLEEQETKENFNCRSILTLLTSGRPFHLGGQVKITARGEYPIKILQECVEQLGKVFSFKDISRTTWEILYRGQYGHYPDEKPAETI